ncbi:hypothetical protein ACC675_36810, partial [Rhizobium ruizarguesonis]
MLDAGTECCYEGERQHQLRKGKENIGDAHQRRIHPASGKSQTGRAIMGLTPKHGIVTAERLNFNGIDLINASAGERRRLSGKRIAM